MNKAELINMVIAELEQDLQRQQAAAAAASEGATDEESRAETQWDTCGLESSYLARGHARQFQQLTAEVHGLRSFMIPDFTNESIGPGALVGVALNNESLLFFLLPCGGGMELAIGKNVVTVITPVSLVGSVLLGKKKNDSFSFRAGSVGRIISVS